MLSSTFTLEITIRRTNRSVFLVHVGLCLCCGCYHYRCGCVCLCFSLRLCQSENQALSLTIFLRRLFRAGSKKEQSLIVVARVAKSYILIGYVTSSVSEPHVLASISHLHGLNGLKSFQFTF